MLSFPLLAYFSLNKNKIISHIRPVNGEMGVEKRAVFCHEASLEGCCYDCGHLKVVLACFHSVNLPELGCRGPVTFVG